MNEMFLLKMGEIVLKGLNRASFEGKLHSNLSRRLKPYGKFKIRLLQSTVYVEPENEDCDLDGAWEACGRVFGIISRSRSRGCEKDLDAIFTACQDYLGDDIACAKSFKVESKRADKRFPLNSIQISQEIGGRLAEAYPEVAVDVHHPDYTVYVEVREERAFVHGPAEPGAGGLPVGVGGKTALLLSGGIDSPVAGYMMAKRGVELECVHFFSYPYTSERAKEKVLDLARIMTRYCGRITVHVVPFTKIQEEIRDNCHPDYAPDDDADFGGSGGEAGLHEPDHRRKPGPGGVSDHAGNDGDQCRVPSAGVPPGHRHGQGGDHRHCPENRDHGDLHPAL